MEHLAVVVDAFAQVLPDEEPVDADTDLFDAGGNSVRAARVVARLRQELGVRVSMEDIFQARTPNALLARLDRRLGAVAEAAGD